MENTSLYTGSHVVLRRATREDAADIVRWRNHPAVSSHFIHREPLTVGGHLDWYEKQVESGKTVQFLICLPVKDEEGRQHLLGIGSVYLSNIDKEEHSAEYGIFIGDDQARGKGFGVEAARLALQAAFEDLHLTRVYLRVYEDNTAARRSYEAAGFRVCGRLDNVKSTDGSVADMLLMEVTATDYESAKKGAKEKEDTAD